MFIILLFLRQVKH